MKLKTLGLLVASAIGVSSHALTLDNRIEVDTNSTYPITALSDEYYSNSIGHTYKIDGTSTELLYDLHDSTLLDIEGEKAIGYLTDVNHAGSNYFICKISDCNDASSRKFISNIDYLATEQSPLSRSINMFSGYGNALVIGKTSATSDYYLASVIDDNGGVLATTSIRGSRFSFTGDELSTLTATTGITKEENFKFMTASHGTYDLLLREWDKSSGTLKNINIFLNDGVSINTKYSQYGVAPVSISNPFINASGETMYRAVLAIMSSATLSNSFVWGDFKIENGVARFTDILKSVGAAEFNFVEWGNLITNNPVFISENEFSYGPSFIDFNESNPVFESLVFSKEERTFQARVFKVTDSGAILLRENSSNYKIFKPNTISISSSKIDIDPYLDPSIELVVLVGAEDMFGAEVSCELQVSNMTVDNNDYVALSASGLQVPIEWDAEAGNWKGAQSLTGIDSISGSYDFSTFNLTADVTTGSWTMSCSGFASDIQGNKLAMQATDITLNLDDKIHGGSGVISGSVDLSNHADYSGVVVTITFENGRHIEVTPDENGDFSFDRLVEGEFEVHVYNEQYVAGCNTVQVTNANTNLPLNIVMVAGDINGDDAVDIGDYSYMSSMYGLTSADEGFDAVADLNQDDVINVQDLSILGSHFGTDQCEAVAPQ